MRTNTFIQELRQVSPITGHILTNPSPQGPRSSTYLPTPTQGNLNLNSTLPLSLLPVAEKINLTLPR